MKIPSDEIQLNVEDVGNGTTTLVFLHHWGGSSRTWSEVTLHLRDHFRCVAIDARGAGNSDVPSEGYSTRNHAADALNVIKALKLERYMLVGHSMGGKASQLLASQRPPGLIGLVLVASSPLSPMAIDDAQRERMKVAYKDRNAVEWTLENVLLGSAIPSASRAQLISDALRLSPEATRGWIEIGTREDFSERTAAIDVPVSIMAGELDRVDPVQVVKTRILPLYPSASMHFLPNKGHLLPLEAPEQVAALIRSVVDL